MSPCFVYRVGILSNSVGASLNMTGILQVCSRSCNTRNGFRALSRALGHSTLDQGRLRRRLSLSAMAEPPSFSLLQYDYVPDILEKRGPHREAHLGAAKVKQQEGKLVMAGAVGDPVSGGLFIFKNTPADEIEEFAKNDAYTVNGLITGWKISPYMVAVGNS